MFSGITRGLFKIIQVNNQPGLLTYTIELNQQLVENLRIGASVAVDGVCQSVTKIQDTQISFQAMQETLEKTTLKSLQVGQYVSIERSLRYGDEIGGHEVSGHVTGTATVNKIDRSENNLTLLLAGPAEWMKYIVPKGFIAVDGSSLTVGDTQSEGEGSFSVHLIPETLRLTNFGNKKLTDQVNIEIDSKTRLIVDAVNAFLLAR